MNVYLYIAENNPDAAYEICKKYGYFNINSMEELADSLKSIVAEQGQGSLEEILNIHPEKEVILEIFDKKKVIEEKPLEEIIQSHLINISSSFSFLSSQLFCPLKFKSY